MDSCEQDHGFNYDPSAEKRNILVQQDTGET